MLAQKLEKIIIFEGLSKRDVRDYLKRRRLELELNRDIQEMDAKA